MTTLDKQTFDTIVEVLVPYMDTIDNRRSFVTQALHDAPMLLQRVSYEGNAHQFTVELVKTCNRYGQITAGQSAITALLTHLREQVGHDRQQNIDRLIARIEGETGRAGSIPPDLRENPAQAIEQGEDAEQNVVMKILRDPLWQFVGVVIAVVAIVIGIVTSGGPETSPQPVLSQPTPSTPRITAQQNMDIRSGPGTNFDRIAVLNAGDHLDILGISDDDRWYQVLLPDGNMGWVVAASSAGEVSGPLGALAVIVLTNTPTATLTRTPTATSTPTASPTSTDTPEPTDIPSSTDTPTATRTNTPSPSAIASQAPSNTPTHTPSITPRNTPTATATRRPTSTPTNTPRATSTSAQAYPCDGSIPGVPGAMLNQVHVQPSESSPSRPPVQRGSTVTILREASDFGETWYEIRYNDGDDRGWIPNDFVERATNCPS